MGKATPRTATPSPPSALALGRVETLLAACWLLVPALQYFITMQLTAARLGHETPMLAVVWPVVTVYGDFTPLYLVMVAVTVGLVAVRALGGKGSRL